MSNIANGSSRLWAHLIVTYIFAAILIFELRRACRLYAMYRRRYLETPRQSFFVVAVRDIPKHQANVQALRDKYNAEYADLQGATMLQQTKDLNKCAGKRVKALVAQHRARALAARKGKDSTGDLGAEGQEDTSHMTSSANLPSVAAGAVSPSRTRSDTDTDSYAVHPVSTRSPILSPKTKPPTLLCGGCHSKGIIKSQAAYDYQVEVFNRQVSIFLKA